MTKLNRLGIDSWSRTHYGTRLRIGFTYEDGNGEDDQVASHVIVDVPNERMDKLAQYLMVELDDLIAPVLANYSAGLLKK